MDVEDSSPIVPAASANKQILKMLNSTKYATDWTEA
jgi:hypothetical protein